MRKREDGFTLLELMIVMLIVAILASIAYPSYTSYMQSSRRTYAKTALLDIAGQLERCYADQGNYYPKTDSNGDLCAAEAPSGSVDLTDWTTTTTGDYYRITGNSDDNWQSQYILTAEPVGSQVGDACGAFTLDEIGRHDLDGNTDSQADCGW
ncbi:type IV pilin protein [Salinicola sp. 4072]|uniref:type IV pilin protein n=1 Tax=Salinicola sp. 4072 TaxID=3082157 RepID=UPI002FCB2186